MHRPNLAKRVILASLGFYGFVGLLLFLPAWTLRFWQAWVYIAINIGCQLATKFYFLRRDPAFVERRLAIGPAAEKTITLKRIQSAISVLMVAALVVASLDHRGRWSRVPAEISWLGDGLIVAAYGIVFIVFRQNRFASATIEINPGQHVISTGIYGVVRHPMYAGSALMFLATPLALGSCVGAIPMCVFLVIRLLHEERFLRRNLSGYDEYCVRVRKRLIPAVW